MRRLIAALLLAVCAGCPLTAFAAQIDPDVATEWEQIGGAELVRLLPDTAADVLDGELAGISSPLELLTLPPGEFWQALKTTAAEQVKKPLKALAAVIGIVILCAMLHGLKDASGGPGLSPVFQTVASLCVATSVALPALECIKETAGAVRQCGIFLTSFIPIFAGVMAAAGQPVTAATYHTFMFASCQVASQFTVNVLIPLLGVYMAFCLVGSLLPGMDILSLAGVLKNAVTWVLGLMVSLFVGLMSIQSLVAASGDSVTAKATKFIIGSVVPVVGSALSDAFVAAQGCIKLLRTSLGGFGILAVLLTFVPIILRVVMWYITINLAAGVGGVLGVGQLAALLRSISSALAILLSILLCYALFIIATTTILLLIGGSA